jgi:NAD(P)-dependent dehydrogenase (short-subunit alcohol dehydrogenase family)
MAQMKDRVALVNGGSRGIGAATAKELARRGTRVAVRGRTVSDLKAVAVEIKKKGGRSLVLPCDVTDKAEVEHMVG